MPELPAALAGDDPAIGLVPDFDVADDQIGHHHDDLEPDLELDLELAADFDPDIGGDA